MKATFVSTVVQSLHRVVFLMAALFAILPFGMRAADWTDSEGVEYSALGYIKASGSQWIVTDIQPVCTDTVKMKFRLTATGVQALWCSRGTSTSASTFTAFYIDQVVRCDRNSGTTSSGTTKPGTGTDCTVVADYNTCRFMVNGAEQSAAMESGTFTPGSKLMLFASHTAGSGLTASSATANRGSYYLYYFEMYDSSGTLKHRLMPAMRDVDSVAGLYDTTTGKFYPPASGTFTYAKGRRWIGASGGLMSDAENWDGGEVPAAGDDLDLSGAAANSVIVADVDGVFGDVYLGDGVLTFRGAFSARRYTDHSKIVVAPDSTVTLDGDLAYSSGKGYVARLIGANGKFVVTGTVSITGSGELVPTVEVSPGYIVAKGLANNRTGNESWHFRIARDASETRWSVGEDGITGSMFFWTFNNGNTFATICPGADFTIGTWMGIGTSSKGMTLVTTGLNETDYVITAGSNETGGGFTGSRPLTVKGGGTLVCNYNPTKVGGNGVEYNGSISVVDSATLQINEGKQPTYGSVTIGGTATLSVPGAVEVTPGGALTMQQGATLNLAAAPVVAPAIAVSGAVSLNGKLTLAGGPFGEGTYPILVHPGIASMDALDFIPLLEDTMVHQWKVENDVLTLTVLNGENQRPVLDEDDSSITISGSVVTIAWKLISAGGETADIKAVVSDANGSVKSFTIAERQISGASGIHQIHDVWSDKAISVTLFADCRGFLSSLFEESFAANAFASVLSAPSIEVDETAKMFTVVGTLSTIGSGPNFAWIDYGETLDYGTKQNLPLSEGYYVTTFPYTDVLWVNGNVHARVTVSNSVAGVLGSFSWTDTALLDASFAKPNRTAAVVDLDDDTGEITLAFGGGAIAEQTIVVAWGDRDYGSALADWPYNKRLVLGTVASNADTGTFVLPEDVRVPGKYYRLFLGAGVVVGDYDHEAEWIQPAVLGAYIATDFVPAQFPLAEMKINMDSKGYYDAQGNDLWSTVVWNADGWPSRISTEVNSKGQIRNVRIGMLRFGPYGTSDDLVINLTYTYASYHKAITVNGVAPAKPIEGVYNNYNQNYTVKPTKPLFLWAQPGGAAPSAVKLYYMKWMTQAGELQFSVIPVKRGQEYCLYDVMSGKLMRNIGADGTSFTGGGQIAGAYRHVYYAAQTAATGAAIYGAINVEARLCGETATLAWPMLGEDASLWVVYSRSHAPNAPGKYSPGAWDRYVKLADLIKDEEGGTYTLPDVESFVPKCRSHRFVIATADSSPENLKPLMTSNVFPDVKTFHIILR